MKLSRTSWIILIAGILVVAFGSLGVAGAQQTQQRSQLEEELSLATKRLDNLQLKDLSLKKEDLDKRLAQVQDELTEDKEALHKSLDSIEVTDFLFQLAEDADVHIIEINSSNVDNDKLEGITLAILRLNLRVGGEVANLIDYIARLNAFFSSGTVRTADINTRGLGAEGTTTGNTTPPADGSGPEWPTANIQLVIYSYLGE